MWCELPVRSRAGVGDDRPGAHALGQPGAGQPPPALQPSEVAGEVLEPGDVVLVLQGGANRDPDRFEHAETPGCRSPDNHPLSFGWRIHHCLGAPLARMEGEIVFNSLFERFESIELLDESPEWRPNLTLRGLAALPVRVF